MGHSCSSRQRRRARKRKRIIRYLCLLLLVLIGLLVWLILTDNPSEKGVEYLEQGQYQEAIEQFEKAIEKDVNVGDAYRGIGIAKWEQEDYEGARDAFQSALENGAQETGTLYNFLGNCELKLGNPEAALNDFQLGLEQEGNSDELTQEMRYNRIAAYEQTKEWETARAELREYVADYPEDAEAQKELEFLETRLLFTADMD